MAKIINDKYYTGKDTAEYIVKKTKEIIGEENITEWLEPSAGSGVFLDFLDNNYKAYDIEPEHENIVKADYLKLELEYLKGRCIIGNPPFGRSNNLALKFFKKSIILGDYIAFILPISQLNNTIKMYEFDLIYSEDIGELDYSDRLLHCCFNVYRRPDVNLNKKPNYKLKDVDIVEWCRNRTKNFPEHYDIGICGWGAGCVGKEVTYKGQYASEWYITINNKKYKDEILKIIRGCDWKKTYPAISSNNLAKWQILKNLKEQIPELI